MYHDDAEVIVEWYMAIRSAKLNLLQVAHPTQPETEVGSILVYYPLNWNLNDSVFKITVGTIIDSGFS